MKLAKFSQKIFPVLTEMCALPLLYIFVFNNKKKVEFREELETR